MQRPRIYLCRDRPCGAALESFCARFYDIGIDPLEGDMTRETTSAFLISCVNSGKFIGIMLAHVCSSWSQALHRTNVIGSYAHPWCLPGSLRLMFFLFLAVIRLP